ncbi:MAG: hypothetical protein QXR30_03955 [Candidatus Woesearchaeota archaeon]
MGDIYSHYQNLLSFLNPNEEIKINITRRDNLDDIIREYLDLLKSIKLKHKSIRWELSSLAESDPQSNNFFLNILYFTRIINILENYKEINKGELIIFIEDNLLGLAIISYLKENKYKFNTYNLKINNKIIFYLWLIYGSLKENIKFLKSMLLSKFLFYKYNNLQFIQTFNNLILLHSFINKNSLLSDGNIKDNFYGELSNYLNKNGYRVVYLLNDVLFFENKKKIIEWLGKTNIPVVFIYYIVSIKDIFLSVLFSLSYIFCSFSNFRFRNYDISFLFSLFYKSLSRSQLTNWSYIYYFSLKKLKMLNILPKAIIDIYEGHFWERALRVSKNRHKMKTKIFGINSSAFSKNNVSMFSSFDNELPDKILCSSELYKSTLNNFGIPDEKIEVIGSFRYAKLVENVEKKIKNNLYTKRILSIKTIGIIFPLKYEIAEELLLRIVNTFYNSEYKIRLFFHPFTASKFNVYVNSLSLPKNFSISEKSFYDIYQEIDLVICAFTTMALEALALGIPVIEIERELGIDFGILDFQEIGVKRAKSNNDIINIINELNDTLYDEKLCAEKFLIFFEKINETKIKSIFQE